ncbi:MAG: helix-hairpin-helix domain-containing protein [Candidatus Bathyarchaeia archaeon]
MPKKWRKKRREYGEAVPWKKEWWPEEEETEEWPGEEEEEWLEEVDVYDLTQLPGVDESKAERLRNRGYESLWDIAYADVYDLAEDLGITESKAEEMIESANKLLELR